MTHSRQWNGNSPLDSEQVKFGPTAIRNLKEDFSERFSVDHIIGESIDDGAGQDGHHKQLTMKSLGTTFANLSPLSFHNNSMQLYSFFSEGDLCIFNASGAGSRITKDGYFFNTRKNTYGNLAGIIKTGFNGYYEVDTSFYEFYDGINISRAFNRIDVENFNMESDSSGLITIPSNGVYYISGSIVRNGPPHYYYDDNVSVYKIYSPTSPGGMYIHAWTHKFWGIYERTHVYSYSGSRPDTSYFLSLQLKKNESGDPLKIVYLVKDNDETINFPILQYVGYFSTGDKLRMSLISGVESGDEEFTTGTFLNFNFWTQVFKMR